MSKYVFKPYDEIMPILFKQEKERLLKFLDVEVIIEHVGSTAVPGLGGKGIIDICIAVNKDKMLIISSQIQRIGYEFKPHASVEDRLFHQIDLPDNKEGIRRYHIHIVHLDSNEHDKLITFRDYLIKHPKDMKKYAEIKKKAAKKAKDDKNIYLAIKQPVIDEILTKAFSSEL